jgi:hypothetical protein
VRLSRCEVRDPHQLPQKRSLTLVSILQSLAAAEIANALCLRDFRSAAIFEFFNTICQEQTALMMQCGRHAKNGLSVNTACQLELLLISLKLLQTNDLSIQRMSA